MRIGELSRRSGVTVPTIKFYLREGLLPPGELTSRNQATYTEAHLRRLRLVRALVDLAGVPVARVRAVLTSLDSGDLPLHDRIGAVHRAVTPEARPATDDTEARAFVEGRGWAVAPDAPAIATIAETLTALRSLGQEHVARQLDAYADAVESLAEREVASVASAVGDDRIAENVVVGTVLGERLIAALRLLAHEHVSARVLGRPPAAKE
jgi:DNA-binding transcriptional MerR regulator